MSGNLQCHIESFYVKHLFTAEWKISDWIFYFLLVPGLLLFIYFLPVSVKETYFILYPSKITLYSFFLSNYVHSNIPHISANLSSYLAVCFLIFNFETDKHRFYAYSMLMLLVLPWIISLVSLSIIGPDTTYQGFSGIVSSLYGYLTYVIYRFLKKYCCRNMDLTFFFLIVTMNILLMLGNIPSQLFQYIFIVTFALVLVYLQKDLIAEVIRKKSDLRSWLRCFPNFKQIYIIGLLFATLDFVFILHVLVPSEIMQNGVIVNSVGHYTGYFFGIFVPMLLSVVYDQSSGVHRQPAS